MKALGVFIFLLGMFMFASGWVFLDLASLPLKNDLYSIDVLGFFNNMFSTDMRVAGFQSFMSFMFILMGCLICFAGAIMIQSHRSEETEEERINRELWEGGYPPYNDKNLRYYMPNYERVGKRQRWITTSYRTTRKLVKARCLEISSRFPKKSCEQPTIRW